LFVRLVVFTYIVSRRYRINLVLSAGPANAVSLGNSRTCERMAAR
jgi:hypothetical protein